VLAGRGAQVALACRDLAKAEHARARIAGERPSGTLEVLRLDLADLASVRAFVEAFIASHVQLDALVCNAGVMAIPRLSTSDGFERQMGTNHLGHFALVGRLLPTLLATPGARVVVVSSGAHKMGRLDLLDDPFFERHSYGRWQAYGQSKLANLLFVMELDRRLRATGAAVRAIGAHPGYAATELQRRGAELGGPKIEGWLMAISNALIAQSAASGAWPILRAAADPGARGGDYFGPARMGEMRGPAVRVEPESTVRDPAAAQHLWAWSESVTGVRYAALS
jgi:NAD(P)-dependent dehydrogenase (short-subunit alcohol dehydrogenase family)